MKSWWLKDFTSLLQWRWFTDVPTAHFWEYVRLRANNEDGEFHDIPVARGSFISSVAHMSIESGLSPKQIRLAIKKLEKTGEILVEGTNKYTRITIVKYGEYQGSYVNEGKQRDTQRYKQKEEQRATIKDDIEDKKNRNKEITKEIFDCSPEFAEALEGFEEMRKKIKSPLTDRAKKLLLKDLSKLAQDEETQIKILNRSTLNGWKGIYPLNEKQNNQKGMVNILDL